MSLLTQLDQKIVASGDLIVSCQPIPDSPLDKPEIVAAVVLAAEQVGAVAIRIEGVTDLQTTCVVVSVPIIRIVKRDLGDSPVRITAYIEDVDALAQADVGTIAIGDTDRPRPVPVETLLTRIHHHGLLVMTDYSTPEDDLARQKLGAEIIGTTLSGYTTSETPEEPNLVLAKTLSDAECRAITGRRHNTPARTAGAVYHGVWAMTVGSVITRLEHVCQWYNTAMEEAVL